MNRDASLVRVLTLANEQYAMPLAVMGRSLLENYRSERPLLLKIIDGGLTAASRERVERSWAGAARGQASWEWVTPSFGNAERLPVWGRVPVLTYARMFLDTYFEGDGGRIILLDSDTLVLADVAELLDIGLDGKVVGACVDPFIPTVSSVDGLPVFVRSTLPPDTPYFNAGVMVADLGRWREERVGERSLSYIATAHAHLRHYDQDPLNIVLAEGWKRLDESWNMQPRTANALGRTLPERPRIVHFSGRLKPWSYEGRTPWDVLFYDYLRRTDWREFRVPSGWEARALWWYDSPLRRIVYPVECRALALWRRLRGRGAVVPLG